MGFLEKAVVRGTRELLLREFNELFHEVLAYAEEFRAKAKAKAKSAAPVFTSTWHQAASASCIIE